MIYDIQNAPVEGTNNDRRDKSVRACNRKNTEKLLHDDGTKERARTMTTPFVFSTKKTVCPCGHGKDYTPLVSHTNGGKCWAAHCGQKFFLPTDNSPITRNFDIGRNPVQYDLKPTAPQPEETYTFVRQHIYWQPDGENYLFRVVVHKAPSGRKKVWQERWQGTIAYIPSSGLVAHGTWIKGLANVPLTLYNAPMLAVWKDYYDRYPEEPRLLFIVEGEKDCETLGQYVLFATCNPMGAGKWKPEFSPLVQGFDVVILPDYDKAGIEHAEDVALKVAPFARSVRIVKLWEDMPDLPPKSDVTDYLERGGKL